MQGWIKGVNTIRYVQGAFAPGQDGYTGENNTGFNRFFARVEMAIRLQYFENDYEPINNQISLPIEEIFYGNIQSSLPQSIGLYNGNIVGMITDIRELSNPIQGMSYGYVQLHSIIDSKSFNFNGQFSPVGYHDTEYSYDENGNLIELFRKH